MEIEETVFKAIKEGLEAYIKTSGPLLAKREYHNSTIWTKRIRGITENAFLTMNVPGWNSSKLAFADEWFRIDTLLLECSYDNPSGNPVRYKDATTDGCTFWAYESKLRVAAEYENDKNLWCDEVDKLSHIRCDLKVLISYSNAKGSSLDYYGLLNEKVKVANRCISNSESAALADKWLLVFLPNNELDLNKLVAYKMDNKVFKRL